MNGKHLLELSGVEKLSLRGIDFVLMRGERVAILGESGAGKSVFLSIVLGLLKPDRGLVKYSGGSSNNGLDFYDNLGVAFQQPGLFDALSISGNISLGRPESRKQLRLNDLLRSLNLDTLSPGSSVSNLSGGQQKRVAIARALVHAKELLILDEPTTGLDSRSTDLVIEVLKNYLQDRVVGLLMITHDYKLAYELCDRIMLISNGLLKDVTPPRGGEEDSGIRSLREELGASSRAVSITAKPGKTAGWSVSRYLAHFLPAGLLLSVPIMILISIMLVAQSRGMSPIDISRYVPGVITLALFRELVPLVVGLLLVSRIGGTIAAEVSGMSYSSQLDSMKVMNLSPYRFILRPISLAAVVTYPVSFLIAGALGVFCAAQIAQLPWSGLHIGTDRFAYLAIQALTTGVIVSCILKGVIAGLGVAMVSFLTTARPVRNASVLGSVVTRASVLSSIFVVIVDITISWVFFSGGRT